MGLSREDVEAALATVSRDLEEAEAQASQARDALARLASGITTLAETRPDEVRAAADTLADALARYHALRRTRDTLRDLLF